MIWNQIKKILKGKISTYKEIAIKIGNSKVYLAVANAYTKNLKLLTIPCHKVMRSSGKMG